MDPPHYGSCVCNPGLCTCQPNPPQISTAPLPQSYNSHTPNSVAHPVGAYYSWSSAAPYGSNPDQFYGYQYSMATPYPAPPVYHPPPLQSTIPQPHLGDITSSIVNTGAVPAASSTSTAPKRKSTGKGRATAAKRRNAATQRNDENRPPMPPAPSISGVGPQVPSSGGPPIAPPAAPQSHISILPAAPKIAKPDATDVWYFVRGLESKAKPQGPVHPAPSDTPPLIKQPQVDVYPILACRLCSLSDGQWTTWKNCDGQTKTIRKHLISSHLLTWEELVLINKLKGADEIQDARTHRRLTGDSGIRSYEPFSLTTFNERLIRWISADDQSMGVVDCEEFRELLQFICPSLRHRGAIPHRTKLADMVSSTFRRQHEIMLSDIENSLGRVSFTSDIWSRQSLQSYMAVTAHYLAHTPTPSGPLLTLQTRLVAFRALHGSHSGVNIAAVFLKVLEEINCLHKMAGLTLDNASNNATMCEEVEAELAKMGIHFHHEGNRIRCFPHVINIAVQTGIKYLGEVPPELEETNPGEEDIPFDDWLYLNALRGDVIGSIRRFVNACRSSGQRREQFAEILRRGNANGGFGDPKKILRDIGLKRDMDTRWSSLYIMVEIFLELWPVCAQIIAENPDLSDHSFTEAEISVAKDVLTFLQVFHCVQELVSAEKTPTLSLVLPLYEMLISILKDLAVGNPKIAHAIKESVRKLEEYLSISRDTKMYVLAMIINPKVKFKWLQNHWDSAKYESARKSIIASLTEYEKATRKPRPTISLPERAGRTLVKSYSASHEAISQAAGYERLKNLSHAIKKTSSLSAIPDTDPPPSVERTPTIDNEELTRREDEAGKRRVDDELAAYEDAGLWEETAPLDLLRYWQDHMLVFPLLYRIALDVLPVQASAVPCERVFSSSKETDTNRRANISPERMEQLQILKFGFRGERVHFADTLLCTERELSVLDACPEAVREMYARGEITQLDKYIARSWESWGAERAHEIGIEDTSSHTT